MFPHKNYIKADWCFQQMDIVIKDQYTLST